MTSVAAIDVLITDAKSQLRTATFWRDREVKRVAELEAAVAALQVLRADAERIALIKRELSA